ncbi:MAG: phosphodiester glycosidase family protein [Acidimicrobiia bacterium]
MKTSPLRVLVAVAVVLSIVVPGWGASAGAASLPVPAGFEVTARRELAPGVEHVTLTRRQPPLVMNVARIAPSAKVDLQVVSAFDKVGPRENKPESLEHPTAMCARVGCLVGVNGDFFHPGSEEPYGAVATGGRLLRSPAVGRGQAWQTRGGDFVVGGFAWSGTVTPTKGGAISITGVNVDTLPNGVVLYTPDYGSKTRAPAGSTELVVKLSGSPVLGQPVTVTLVKMGDGFTPIPADGAVLTGEGGAADALRDLWNRRGSTGPIALRLDADVVETVGIYPVLISGGQRVATTLSDDLTAGRHSRSLVGRTADGSLILATIDDKWVGVSDGVSTKEATDLLLGLGVVEGGNLDGGGGSTLVVGGDIANRPSDGPGSPASEHDGPVAPHQYAPGLFERTAVNMLAIVPKGGSVPGGSGSGGPSGGSNGGGVTTPGGGLFTPSVPGDTGLFGPTTAGVGAAAAGSVFAPSPLDSTPLASASALFKVFTLMKAKAAASGAADATAAPDTPAESTSTTAGGSDGARSTGDGESATGITEDSGGPASRPLSLLIVVGLLLASMVGVLRVLHRGRPALVLAVLRLRTRPGDGL